MAHGGQAPKDVITFASSYYEKEIQKLYLFFNKFGKNKDVKDVAIVFWKSAIFTFVEMLPSPSTSNKAKALLSRVNSSFGNFSSNMSLNS